jgi:hypothetical protein
MTGDVHGNSLDPRDEVFLNILHFITPVICVYPDIVFVVSAAATPHPPQKKPDFCIDSLFIDQAL